VQSFDVRPLQELRKMPKQFPLALLVGNKDGIEKNLELLGFLPDTYSPHFSLVDEQIVKFCHQKGIKIIPWTVNEISDMEKMRNLKVDGIITDFPNRLVQILKK
jgi:glycerophosphoryl diester phosphodiesterase